MQALYLAMRLIILCKQQDTVTHRKILQNGADVSWNLDLHCIMSVFILWKLNTYEFAYPLGVREFTHRKVQHCCYYSWNLDMVHRGRVLFQMCSVSRQRVVSLQARIAFWLTTEPGDIFPFFLSECQEFFKSKTLQHLSQHGTLWFARTVECVWEKPSGSCQCIYLPCTGSKRTVSDEKKQNL